MMKSRSTILTLLFVLILSIFGFIIPDDPNPRIQSLPDYNRFWTQKVHQDKIFNGIILGDSRIYRGVAPHILSDELRDYRFYNFGFSSGGLNPEIYREAEKCLKNEGGNIIIVGLSPGSLTPMSKKNKGLRKELARRPAEVIDRLYISYYLKMFRPHKPDFFRAVLLKENDSPDEYYYQEFYDNGWVKSELKPENPAKALPSYRDLFLKQKVSEELVEKLAKQVHAWSIQGNRVFVFRSPSSPSMEQLEDAMSGYNEEFIKNKIQLSGGIWLDFNSKDYHSYDGSHLHYQSALKFSHDLAQKIKENL